MTTNEAFAEITRTAAAYANGCDQDRRATIEAALNTLRTVLLSDAVAASAPAARAELPPLHTTLPDSDITVLALLDDPEEPVWPCFHDGESWRLADASICRQRVLGWMHLDAAAAALRIN